MDENANRLANFLRSQGAGPRAGLAIMMKNSPRWLDVFFGLEKLGMYAVPVNVALRHDQLAYIVDNSEARILVIDHDLLEHYQAVADKVPGIRNVIVNTEGAPRVTRSPWAWRASTQAYGPARERRQAAGARQPRRPLHNHVHLRHNGPAQGRRLPL